MVHRFIFRKPGADHWANAAIVPTLKPRMRPLGLFRRLSYETSGVEDPRGYYRLTAGTQRHLPVASHPGKGDAVSDARSIRLE